MQVGAEGSREQICRTVYETECWTKQNVHEVRKHEWGGGLYADICPYKQVEDDVVTCETVTEAVCEDEVSGYTARPRCSSVPRQQCSLAKQRVQKVTPETSCDKQPVEVCAPRGCGFVNVRYSPHLLPTFFTGS